MSGPCPRPECGGEVHTDGWGTPVRCPELYRPDAIICSLAQRTPHDAHEHEGLRCPGWAPDDGTRPEQPPALSESEQLRADNESLRYHIQRAREALGTDEPDPTDQLKAAIERVRQLHRPVEFRDRGTICAECSAFDGSSTDNSPVGYAHCATLKALNGEAP